MVDAEGAEGARRGVQQWRLIDAEITAPRRPVSVEHAGYIPFVSPNHLLFRLGLGCSFRPRQRCLPVRRVAVNPACAFKTQRFSTVRITVSNTARACMR